VTVYLFYLFASLLWNAMAAAAHRHHGGLPRRRRILTYVAFGGSVVGLTWVGAGSAFSSFPLLYLLSGLLPVAAAAAAIQCVWAARHGQRPAWILAGYNAFLALTLGLRWFAELGVRSGVFGDSLSFSYAVFQSMVFLPALWLPMYVQIPWIARPSSAPQSVTRFVWWVGVSFAALTLVVVLWVWPAGWTTVSSWSDLQTTRADRSAGETPLIRSTKILETLRAPRPRRFFDRELERLDELGLEAATVFVSDDLLWAGPEGMAELERFAERNRTAGRLLVVSVQGPAEWYQRAWPDSLEIKRVLGSACRKFAERLQPDIEIIAGDPLMLTRLLSGPWGVRGAARVLTAVADSVRLGSPRTRVGLYGFEPWPGLTGADSLAAARRLLYLWAASDSSAIDRVGFALHPGFGDPREFDLQLAATDSMLGRLGDGKKAWVFEFAVSPVTSGEVVQRRHLERVIEWARARSAIEGVSQLSLGDYAERVGLVNGLGRRRAAFDAYRQR
jgi:hypothetical protein